jgi:lipopolysaccharide/colanic/teichoic acid biosynthesis glycosyltransferase
MSDASRPNTAAARPLLVPIAPTNPAYALAKRLTDIVVSTIALVMLAIPLLFIALLIFITSGRPIIYRQTRLGLGGRPFTLYKFRTMVPTADRDRSMLLHMNGRNGDNGPIYKPEPNSATITPLGRLLRKFSNQSITSRLS